MLKRILVSVSVILLFSSSTFANVGNVRCVPVGSYSAISQGEEFSIGAFNMVKRVGGIGCAEGGNLVLIGQSQEAQAAGSTAIQKEIGVIAQCAKVSGIGGLTKVLQDASADASQDQNIEGFRYGSREQEQNLDVGLDNIVHKTNGIGRAEGVQAFIGAQHQIEDTPGGTSENSQIVGVLQYANVVGGPCSNIIVNNSVDVNMGQRQDVTTGKPFPPKPCPPSPPCGDP